MRLIYEIAATMNRFISLFRERSVSLFNAALERLT